jgi:hypothetical protein
MNPHLRALAALALVALSWPSQAWGFCGFYVSGADQDMFNDATQVVMMRQGTKTVLSMRNAYEGPPEDFAMVVPVPVVLQKDDVQVLDDALFDKVDALSAPRLVEYWEQDPCSDPVDPSRRRVLITSERIIITKDAPKIEAQFEVGEYDVVVLSATESNGLEAWLRQEKYNIPEGSSETLASYVQQGMYFFVAKVDPERVAFEGGRAMLSPLRFHYDSEAFTLPVRLGLLNAKGAQDLIVNILAPNQRYEVANRPNVTIPTNLVVDPKTRARFGEFYNALFDHTLEANPGAVVTEYAWQSMKCDPCPYGSGNAGLSPLDLATLGGDLFEAALMPQLVLTRLHARYTADDLDDDLIFEAAAPIIGGVGTPSPFGDGPFEREGASPSQQNMFQGRYAMLNAWTDEVACEEPKRGYWGGPPSGQESATVSAQNVAFAPRGEATFESFLAREGSDEPADSAVDEPAPPTPRPETDITTQPRKNACASAPLGAPASAPWGALAALAACALGLRRRR